MDFHANSLWYCLEGNWDRWEHYHCHLCSENSCWISEYSSFLHTIRENGMERRRHDIGYSSGYVQLHGSPTMTSRTCTDINDFANYKSRKHRACLWHTIAKVTRLQRLGRRTPSRVVTSTRCLAKIRYLGRIQWSETRRGVTVATAAVYIDSTAYSLYAVLQLLHYTIYSKIYLCKWIMYCQGKNIPSISKKNYFKFFSMIIFCKVH